jgi:hypothetical protein
LAPVWSLLASAFLILPLGALLVAAAGLGPGHQAARLALVGVVGYTATTLVAVVLGTVGWLPLFPYVCGTWCGLWVLSARRARDIRPRRPAIGVVACWPGCAPASIVIAIACLSLVAITPLMVPVRSVGSNQTISYAYIDAYQSLAMVQGLVRHVPLAEHYSLAGLPPRVYPDFHYVYLAMLARVTGASATDVYFRDGAVLLVLLGLPLAYAVGREITRQRLGGYVAATLLYLGVVPNPYDLNLALANVSVPYMPTFYQTHFYSPRYNQHEGAGMLLIMGAVLCLLLSEQARDHRGRIGSLVIGGCLVAALARFRSQHLLSAGPAFLLMVGGLALGRRDWRYLAGPAAFAVMLGCMTWLSFGGHYDVASTHLLIRYGDFGRELLARWYLPARFQTFVAGLPAPVAPAVAIIVWAVFRIVGCGLGLLVLARVAHLLRDRSRTTTLDLFCAATFVCAVVASLLVRREAITLGRQIMQVSHLLGVLIAVAPLTALVRRAKSLGEVASIGGGWVGVAVLATLTLVAFRAADAALHDQMPRGYPISREEQGAYAWIHAHTPVDAVVAAHPDHRVNADRETVRTTDVLSAMTDRRVFLQRAAVDQGTIRHARATQLREVFAATSPSDLCTRLAGLTITYLLEYPDTPLVASEAACLQRVFTDGEMRVYRVGE